MAVEFSEHKTNLLTCSLKMLRAVQCDGEEMNFKGVSVASVETVVRVKEIKETSLRYEILMEDHTGRFSGYLYKKNIGNKDNSLKQFVYKENTYAVVYGNFRKTQENPTFIISSIANINSRAHINYILSIVLQGYLKLFKPALPVTNLSTLITKALSSSQPNPKGYTAQAIFQMLQSKFPLAEIEEVLNDLLISNQVKNGVDWNHYKLPS